jgi:hypothetical protein
MSDRAWDQEAEQFLRTEWEAFCAWSSTPASAFRIVPPLAPEEARLLILGAEAGLFEVVEEGMVNSSLLPPPDDVTSETILALFSGDPPRLIREAVTKLCAAASLVIERGWLPRQIQIGETSVNGNPVDGVDVRVNSIAGELLAAMVVKRSGHQLGKLTADLRQCCNRGLHPEDNCGFPQNHATFEFCANRKPRYLWAVAPGAEVCLRLNHRENGVIDLDERSSLPPRSIVDR